MRLHKSVVDKLIYYFQTYGGFQNDAKLRSHIENIDLTPYERKLNNNQEMILVDTQDYIKEISKK